MAPPDWVQEKHLTPDERIQRARKRTAAILDKQDQEAKTVAPSKRVIPRMQFHSENGPNTTFTGSEASPTPGPNAPELCGFCARSLRLDDGGPGGFLGDSWDGHQDTLCFTGGKSGKMHTSEYYSSQSNSKRLDWCTGIGASDDGYERCVKPPALSELVESCRFCSAVKELVLQKYGALKWWTETDEGIWYSIQYRWSARRSSERELNRDAEIFKAQLTSVDVRLRHPKFPWGPETFCLSVAMSPGPCRDWLGVGRDPLTGAGLSQPKLEIIKGWIGACESYHNDRELKNGEMEWDDRDSDDDDDDDEYAYELMPKRLLDLGANETCDPILTDTNTIPLQEVRYTCLSYRWGQSMPVTTTRDTIDRHRQGIPQASLPQLFRDAVAVTRALEVRYLWVDALCIVQDMVDEWAREWGIIAEILSHSWLILAAPMASSCEGSLFGERKQLDGLHFQSSANANISGDYSIYLFDDNFHPIEPKIGQYEDKTWAWQNMKYDEKWPPRLLVFRDRMISMSCHGHVFSEDGSVKKTLENMILPYQENLRFWWWQWVSDYSKRELSSGCDKVASVSGLVEWMYQKRSLLHWNCPTSYLGGYESCGLFHLKPRLSFRDLTRPLLDNASGRYVAPSWSSALCAKQTASSIWGHRDYFTVVRRRVEPPDRTGDATAVVKYGSTVTLRGFMRPYPAQATGSASSPVFARKNSSNSSGIWKTKFRSYGPQNFPTESYIKFFLDWLPSVHDDEESDEESHFRLLLLSYGGSPAAATGFLLWRKGGTNGDYFKVGVFKVDSLMEWPKGVAEPDELDGWVKDKVTIM